MLKLTPRRASFRNLVAAAASFTMLGSTLHSQMVYPPETNAIPIPKTADLPLAPGPFKPTAESLKHFQCPDWFTNGKFGIWAHWGPQAVPGDGDWYAHWMYLPASHQRAYADHVKVYGHPSKVGYKDILPLWKAEKWDPDHLMSLYKAAGAHYFVAQAVHHDNFDNWDSKYQKWNSVNMGPHRDIVGIWQQAARKQGLPFGVSEHLGHSFTFMQASHGSDKTGPLAGVPYDGTNPAYWDLYQLPAKPGDTGWYSKDPRWAQEWYARIYDLVTHYKPDLLYSDGGLPFEQTGMDIVAQLYNLSIQPDGKQNAVYCSKKHYSGTNFIDGIGAQDLERTNMTDIQPFPWQTDTSIGDWYYNTHDRYKSTDQIIHLLTDIVSKNGNLLMNVVLYPDGSLPPPCQRFLDEMAVWVKINGEAIFDTHPWLVYGEGPGTKKGVRFNENNPFNSSDIRFTAKGSDIYVTTLGIPTSQINIHSLAKGSPLVTGDPSAVTLLGSTDKLDWSRTDDALTIKLPSTLPCKSALCFKISGLTTVADLAPATLQSYKDHLRAP